MLEYSDVRLTSDFLKLIKCVGIMCFITKTDRFVKVVETLLISSTCTIIATHKRPGLVISMSDYRTRGLGSIPGWAPIY